MKAKKHLYLLFIFFIISCSPLTKEDYLKSYNEFISKIENKKFDKEDWNNLDEEFKKFNTEYYNKFKEELSWKDQIIITKNSALYQFYKIQGNTKGLATEIFGNYSELKKTIKYYSENNMNEDIKSIIKQANDAGGSSTKMLNKVLKDLEVDYNVELKISNNK